MKKHGNVYTHRGKTIFKDEYNGIHVDDYLPVFKSFTQAQNFIDDVMDEYFFYQLLDNNKVKIVSRPEYSEKKKCNLKLIRENRGLTIRELAEKSGINVHTIGRYESGKADIGKSSCMIAFKLSRALNCSMEEILD